jgi:hypothetical protein
MRFAIAAATLLVAAASFLALAHGDEPAPAAVFQVDQLPAPTPFRPKKPDALLYTANDAVRASAVDAQELAKAVDPDSLGFIRYQSIANIPGEFRNDYKAVFDLTLNRLNRTINLVQSTRVGPDGILLRFSLYDLGIDPKEYDRLANVDPYFHQKFVRKKLPLTFLGAPVPPPPGPMGPPASMAGPPTRPTLAGVMRPVRTPTETVPWPGGKWPEDKKDYPPGSFTYEHSADAVKKCVELNPGHPVWTVPAVPPGLALVPTPDLPAYDPAHDKVEVTPAALWLDPKAVATLVELLGTKAPVLRADWFIVTATLPPFYYDLLGLKTLKDAQKLGALDPYVAEVSETRATVVLSGSGGLCRRVARNNRILKRFKTAWGRWWETDDFKTSIARQNVINNFLTDERDGGEFVFSLPAGLDGYFLVNANGDRVDEVPIEIAVDSLADDTRVRTGRSCIWCHTQGIQPFKSDFQLQLDPGGLDDLLFRYKDHLAPRYAAAVGDPKKAAALARDVKRVFGVADFRALVQEDNRPYAAAIRRVANLSAPAAAGLYKSVYDKYAEANLDLEDLVYEAGAPAADVQAAIRVRLNGDNNGVLLRQLKLPPLPIRRDQWEENYADFMTRLAAWMEAKRQLQRVGSVP